MLLWSEQFATGHPTIDEQHRTLFDNINRLEGLLVQTNPSRAEVDFMLDLIGYLEGYVVQHFQLEEQCMESHRCPVFQQNKDAHRQFVAFFQRFRERCQAEGSHRRWYQCWGDSKYLPRQQICGQEHD